MAVVSRRGCILPRRAAGFCFTTHGRNNSSFHKIKQYDKQIDKEYYDKHGGSIEVGSRSKDLYIEARVVASAIVGAIRETKYSHVRPLVQEKSSYVS